MDKLNPIIIEATYKLDIPYKYRHRLSNSDQWDALIRRLTDVGGCNPCYPYTSNDCYIVWKSKPDVASTITKTITRFLEGNPFAQEIVWDYIATFGPQTPHSLETNPSLLDTLTNAEIRIAIYELMDSGRCKMTYNLQIGLANKDEYRHNHRL